MGLFIMEALIACAFFGVLVCWSVMKNPLKWIEDYPPAIVARARKLHLIEAKPHKKSKSFIMSKIVKMIVIVLVLSLVLVFVNGAQTFVDGFFLSYGLWFIVAWFDAFVIDCLWFAHSKRVVIPGTEDMVSEYHNYLFHIKMSAFGCLLGLPVAALVGLHVVLANMIV